VLHGIISNVYIKKSGKKDRESQIKFSMNRLIAYKSVRFTRQFPKFPMTKYSVKENLSGKKILMLSRPQKIKDIWEG
jgi:hypothetical protein